MIKIIKYTVKAGHFFTQSQTTSNTDYLKLVTLSFDSDSLTMGRLIISLTLTLVLCSFLTLLIVYSKSELI